MTINTSPYNQGHIPSSWMICKNTKRGTIGHLDQHSGSPEGQWVQLQALKLTWMEMALSHDASKHQHFMAGI